MVIFSIFLVNEINTTLKCWYLITIPKILNFLPNGHLYQIYWNLYQKYWIFYQKLFKFLPNIFVLPKILKKIPNLISKKYHIYWKFYQLLIIFFTNNIYFFLPKNTEFFYQTQKLFYWLLSSLRNILRLPGGSLASHIVLTACIGRQLPEKRSHKVDIMQVLFAVCIGELGEASVLDWCAVGRDTGR